MADDRNPGIVSGCFPSDSCDKSSSQTPTSVLGRCLQLQYSMAGLNVEVWNDEGVMRMTERKQLSSETVDVNIIYLENENFIEF